MFGFFKNKKELMIKDIVWKNDAIKYRSILDKIETSNKILLLYYFDDTKNEMINALAGKPFTENITSHEKICIKKANLILNNLSLQDRTPVFIEHFPSYKTEKEILDYMLIELSITEISFYISLEDELLKYFGSERIVAVLEKMGFKDDEVIEHSMISKSIQNAQQKIDEKVQIASNTRNSKDWFTMNVAIKL